jgi:carboxymethylenebutenolidase
MVLSVSAMLAGCATTQTADQQISKMMMKEHGHDTPVASPMATMTPAQPVVGKAVVYTTIDGQEVTGWLSKPVNASGDLPAILVIHEWWGLNDNVRRAAEQLAGEGYVTLAVDLHLGNTADTPKDAMKMRVALSKKTPQALDNMQAAIRYLQTDVGATKIGVMGWCQGGTWSLRTALNFPADIDATVIYYGTVSYDEAELAVLDMPVLGIFAADDFIVPPEKAYLFGAAMEGAKKDLEFYMYRDAAHAFSNPSGTDYNPEAAADAWIHTKAFLKRNLQSAE